MGFKLSAKGASKRVKWPVIIQEPVDGGRSVQHKVEVEYEIVPQDVVDELVAQNDMALLRRVVVGWDAFQDENGAALPFDEDHLEAAIQTPYVRSAMLNGYFMAAVGGRRKN